MTVFPHPLWSLWKSNESFPMMIKSWETTFYLNYFNVLIGLLDQRLLNILDQLVLLVTGGSLGIKTLPPLCPSVGLTVLSCSRRRWVCSLCSSWARLLSLSASLRARVSRSTWAPSSLTSLSNSPTWLSHWDWQPSSFSRSSCLPCSSSCAKTPPTPARVSKGHTTLHTEVNYS